MDPNDSMWNETKNEEDMMKKVIAVLVTLVVATGLLCACGVNQAGNEGSNQEQQTQQTQSQATQPSTAETKEAETNSSATCTVEVKDATLVRAYDGKNAIWVNCTWSNLSDKTTSAFSAMECQAFQDGVELDMSWVDQEDKEQTRDIRPGTSLDVCYVFILRNETSTVEVELTASSDDTIVGQKDFELDSIADIR